MEEFLIERLGHQGDGVASGPVFAPRTLPGERVSGIRNGDRLSDVKIIEPSDQRVAAACRHFKSCGGCQLQHASEPFVSEYKQQIVKSALDAHGIETELRPIVTSPVQSRRRATLAVRRTKKGALWGFHARGSDTVVAVPECQLVVPELLGVNALMDDLARIGGSRKGEMAVNVTLSEVGLDVFVTGGKPLDRELTLGLSGVVEAHKLARLTWDDEVIGMRNLPYQNFGAARVAPPPGAFLQATVHGQDALTAAVLDAVSGEKGVDLFAGSGTFTLPLAEHYEMIALEGEKPMIAALDRGWREAKGLKKVDAIARDLFRRPFLPDELAKLDFAVLDPPRAGAEAQVAELAKSEIAQIAYVSCNPVTFARDANVLIKAGFTLEWAQVVDQFRWSSHVELAAKFARSHMQG
ncbi:MAG: class I SAM-dependent RNA methyltransferase [Rhodobacteraceae bacterium]|jgi:23S rRNA (uracil1939-C5)-methyltransferase|nr:23S rRNA (uracil-5-)-methyltransferase [Rhodobacteraceae bacterium HTCC2083]MBT5823122.1 class I SAM-dependent RNA methyltransferase [Paracoccaceae bacterium]